LSTVCLLPSVSIKRRSVFAEHLRSKHPECPTDNLDVFTERLSFNANDTEYASIQDASPLSKFGDLDHPKSSDLYASFFSSGHFRLEPPTEPFTSGVENKSEFSTLENTMGHLETGSLYALSDYSPLSTPVHSSAPTPAPPSAHSEYWMMQETNPWLMYSTDPYAVPWSIPSPHISDEAYHLVSAVEQNAMSWLAEYSVLPTPFLSFVPYDTGLR
jgi:hypothetical protein